MKRYTLYFKQPMNEKQFQVDLERIFSRSHYMLSISLMDSSDEKFIVEIKSDANLLDIQHILQADDDLNDKVDLIEWGWESERSLQTIANSDPLDYKDPYRFEMSQQEDVKEYPYDFSYILVILGSVIFLLGVLHLAIGLLRNILAITIMGFVFSIMLVQGLLDLIINIKCDHNGLEFRRLLRRNQKVQWSDILSLKIINMRYKCCYIRTSCQTLIFPISDFYKLHEKETLIKTILERSSLHFVESLSWGEAVYHRSNGK